MLTDKDRGKLEQDIRDYLDWIDALPYKGSQVRRLYAVVLSEFISFVRNKDRLREDPFHPDLSRHFAHHGETHRPLKIRKKQVLLPDVYEHYLSYQQQSLQISDKTRRGVRRLLALFHEYLERDQIELSNLKIDHLDAFMSGFKIKQSAIRIYRSYLRGFLKYLYHEQGLIKKDLAPLLVGPRQYAKHKPPKFLRPKEVRKLFDALSLKTPADIRTYAIVHLAYFLGLRPVEISRITFDDISFTKGELTLRKRKAHNPITLPVPENVLKAIAAYVLKARPKSPHRHLFLSFNFPYRPMNAGTVVGYLSRTMKKAGLSASGYWLRHTYAQNLLQVGRSIYEVKEMLGHDNIESTGVYLHIHTELMRKVLFNETL
jgi:site-specific recombinase XerD